MSQAEENQGSKDKLQPETYIYNPEVLKEDYRHSLKAFVSVGIGQQVQIETAQGRVIVQATEGVRSHHAHSLADRKDRMTIRSLMVGMVTGIVAMLLSLVTFFKQPTPPPPVASQEEKQEGPHPKTVVPGSPPPLEALMQKATTQFPALHRTWVHALYELDKGEDPLDVKQMILYDLDQARFRSAFERIESPDPVNEKGELVLGELISAFQKDTFIVRYRAPKVSHILPFNPGK